MDMLVIYFYVIIHKLTIFIGLTDIERVGLQLPVIYDIYATFSYSSDRQ